MNTPDKTDEFYEKLRSQLYETSSWPSEYLYKFIVKTEAKKIENIETLFDNLGAVIKTTASKNEKYTSISISLTLKTPEAVIEKYKEVAEKVKGVISL